MQLSPTGIGLLSPVSIENEFAADFELTPKPKYRSECKDGPRPCPFISCRFHLFLEVHPEKGWIKFNFGPDMDIDDMPQTCALDVADDGHHTLKQVGDVLNLTRERVRQLEARAFSILKIIAPK